MPIYFYKLILIFFFIPSLTTEGQWINNPLISPLDIPLALSGNFGEIRGTHFHAGIDIKTNGREGLAVKSVDKGYVNRIRVSTSGYGKCVYIEHLNNTTSVYAHLQKFSPKIEKYIKKAQYLEQTFEIQKYPYKELLPIEKGEIIGYSGNTGGSFGPHLHFEIRNSKTQETINPLLFNLPITDTKKPVVKHLYIFAQNDKTHLENGKEIQKLDIIKVNDSLFKSPNIKLLGQIGIGLDMYDQQNLSYNKNNIYKATIILNGRKIINYESTKFSFTESSVANAFFDYKNYAENKISIKKLFYKPQYAISHFKKSISNGIINIEDNKSYQVIIEISDFHKNKISIKFYIKGAKNSYKNKTKQNKSNYQKITPNKDFLFQLNKNIFVYFPKKSVYDEHYIDLKAIKDTIYIHKDIIPLRENIELNIKLDKKNKNNCIANINKNKEISYVPTDIKNNTMIAQIKKMGKYVVVRDTTPPKITPLNFVPNQWMSNYKTIKIGLEDNFSEIKKYSATINNKWVLFEYEPKNNTLIYNFEDVNFKSRKHLLKVEATDNAGNTSTFQSVFYRKYKTK